MTLLGEAADERDFWQGFHGPNAGYALELYERFRADASAVDAATRALFERLPPPPSGQLLAVAPPAGAPAADPDLVAAAGRLATSIREYGHLAARLDPLGSPPTGDPELDPVTHGLREEQLDSIPAAAISGAPAATAENAHEAISRLRRIYCGTTGYDYDQVQDAEERTWLRDAAETERFRPPNDPINDLALLERLSEVGAFERFLHRQFPGRTRFSIEGTGMLIPMLDEIIGAAAESGTRALLIGMAHRGRLNVLAHVLRKPHQEILAQFRTPLPLAGISRSDTSGQAFSGDVTYHLGARRAIGQGERVQLAVTLAPNPSHLEYVDPVVEGMARAADERRDQPGPPVQDETGSLALLIHGDAAFPAQGVVAETLNLSRLPGYRTGGTVHIIVNNQLGFTVSPEAGRSTLYASDLAKGFEIPIVHVNADDPEACIAAARLAHAYRDRFHKDFMIDLIGYRRWGHNEGDDPSLTQPTMYAKISTHPTVRELWAAELVRRGVVTEADVAAVLANYTKELQAALAEIQAQATRSQGTPTESTAAPPATAPPTETTAAPPDTAPPVERAPAAAPVDVPAVSLATLADLNAALTALPPGFTPHPRLERLILNPRREVFLPDADGRPRTIDWGHAELLAFATILADGTPIRLTGQDTERGTFSQRHAVLHDYTTGEPYIALQTLSAAKASFEVRDSPLSETAAVGFEYGYSVQAPDAFVLWEAQYGDFINGAQVIVDQFIVSARAKWGQLPSLVLLLPHAYEGQGPEHSSGRLERFLELAAEGNIRVAACTTAAQYFHLLRRQAASLAHDARPLIIMTPKSLLRHPLATSPPAALEDEAGFLPVLDDPFFAAAPRDTVRRAILCTGKVYVDLASDARRGQTPGLTLIRVEELYPFPAQELKATLDTYPALREVFWTQEEPRNMGAWTFVQTRIEAIVHQLPGLQGSSGAGVDLQYVGRGERASPAEGSPGRHAAEQARIIDAVYAGLAPTGKPGADEVGAIATQVAAAAARTGSGGD